MSNDPKLDRLQGTPLFSGCDKKALGRLAAAIDIVDVEAGRTLIKQGSIHHEAFIIESGEADVLVDNEIVATIPAGEMIGEIGLLVRGQASATVKARTPMSVLIIPHQRFDSIAHDTPGIGMALAVELAKRLQATDARLH
jgi:CRP-like cAMP-binding protein